VILNELREKTHSAHQAVEGAVDVMRPDLTRDQYERLLLGFYTFYRPLEERLAQTGVWQAERSKLAWLKSDLNKLGFDDQALAKLELCSELPPTASEAHAYGVMYVIEGSTLGGKMITKHLSSQSPDFPTHFFGSYSSDIGLMWRRFLKDLETWSSSHADQDDELIFAATQTFSKLSTWLVKWKRSSQH
jgi:heme oxygenase